MAVNLRLFHLVSLVLIFQVSIMSRITRSKGGATGLRRSLSPTRSKRDLLPGKAVNLERGSPSKKPRIDRDNRASPLRSVKSEDTVKVEDKAAVLRDRKLQSLTKNTSGSIFPTFLHPTPIESKLAHSILQKLHGEKVRPAQVVASKSRAGCGDSPSVLDALVRTILSQNTSDINSTRAKLSMDEAYGGSDEWELIAEGGQDKLEAAIRCGGLSAVKSKVIINILQQTKDKYGSYTLDHLHDASTEDAMAELLSLKGVGPKTASCVLLFCLQRDDFAVDTHVHRITGLLGWRPKSANREQTYAHLNERIPDEDKYGLHVLLVNHGKVCDECKAGGKSSGKCDLRKAFREKGAEIGKTLLVSLLAVL
jgi:endonuclease-3